MNPKLSFDCPKIHFTGFVLTWMNNMFRHHFFIVTSPQHKCLGEWNSYERAPDSAKKKTIYRWTDSAKKQQRFTYGQTVQKKQQTIYIWTDSAKKQQQFTYGQYIFTDYTEDNVQNTHTYTQPMTWIASQHAQGTKVMGVLDIQNTPCAREAILHGAAGSLLAGILHFLATSKWFSRHLICWYVTYFFSVSFSAVLSFTGRVKRSFDVGVTGFMLSTLGSWYVLQKQKTAYSPMLLLSL